MRDLRIWWDCDPGMIASGTFLVTETNVCEIFDPEDEDPDDIETEEMAFN